MTHSEYKALYAARCYAEGLEKKRQRQRQLPWFLETFMPSIISRIGNNPKYPTSCIVSDKQADVIWFYVMDHEFEVAGKKYRMETRGNWNVVVQKEDY